MIESTEPSLSIAITPTYLAADDSMTGFEPRPRWGEGALFEDQGCELGCPGNADIPNGSKTLHVESNSG